MTTESHNKTSIRTSKPARYSKLKSMCTEWQGFGNFAHYRTESEGKGYAGNDIRGKRSKLVSDDIRQSYGK